MNCMSYGDRITVLLANLQLSDYNFIISNLKKLILEMAWTTRPIMLSRNFCIANSKAKHSFSIGLYWCSVLTIILLI